MPMFDGALARTLDWLERRPAPAASPRARLHLATRPTAGVDARLDRLPMGFPGDKYRALDLRRRRAQIRARRLLAQTD